LIRGDARAEIAASLNWRRDTLDRHLGGLRERLGYENTAQLMQVGRNEARSDPRVFRRMMVVR